MPKPFSLKGSFQFQNNALFYHPHPQEEIPHRLEVSGRWRLDRNHNLILGVDESQNQIFGKTISLTTKIESTSKDSLSFTLLKRITPTLKNVHKITLKGLWRADSKNRLIFEIERAGGYDELTFGNTWQLTRNNQIVYIFKRTFLKKRIINSFILKGEWSFDRGALIYRVENSDSSRLLFEVGLKKKSLTATRETLGVILGTEFNYRKMLSLYGGWRRGTLGVDFVSRLGAKPWVWSFKFNKQLSTDKEITFELVNKEHKPVGFAITFSKKILKDSHFFIRAKSDEEKRVEAGVYLPF